MTSRENVENKDAWKQWESEQADQVVDSINRLRDFQGLTMKDMALKLREFGWPVSDNTLLGILSGRKRTSFTLGEVQAFASALNVPPLYLMMGLPVAAGCRVSPLHAETASSVERYQSLTGGPGWSGRPGEDAYTSGVMAATTLGNLRRYAHAMQILRWQNSLSLAFRDFDDSRLEKVFPDWMLNGDALRDSLGDVKEVREQEFGEEIKGFPLPEALAFVDQAEFDPESVALPIVGLTSADELQKARAFVRKELKDAEASTSRQQ